MDENCLASPWHPPLVEQSLQPLSTTRENGTVDDAARTYRRRGGIGNNHAEIETIRNKIRVLLGDADDSFWC